LRNGPQRGIAYPTPTVGCPCPGVRKSARRWHLSKLLPPLWRRARRWRVDCAVSGHDDIPVSRCQPRRQIPEPRTLVSFRQHPRTPLIPERALKITTPSWVRVSAAAIIAVALVIFAVQNTRSVEISFPWTTTRTPLALALLIGAVGGSLLTLVLGTARITQLRRQVRGAQR